MTNTRKKALLSILMEQGLPIQLIRTKIPWHAGGKCGGKMKKRFIKIVQVMAQRRAWAVNKPIFLSPYRMTGDVVQTEATFQSTHTDTHG